MDKYFTGPVRRIISRGLSFPPFNRFPSWSSINGEDQSPLPSAGKRQREEDEDEETGPLKRVKMDIDDDLKPVAVESSESPSVERIRPGVEALSISAKDELTTPPPSNGHAGKSAQSTPTSKRGKYQRGLKGTRKSTAADSTPSTPSKTRLGPKRQQKGSKTIENRLFDALVKVGAVSEDNSDDPTKVNIQRAARTDAGVHAARNLVSIKIIMELPGVTDLVEHINEQLPPEIRIWDIVRTQNSFNSRMACDSRKYSYCFPTYMLIPPSPDSPAGKAIRDNSDSSYDSSQHPFWQDVANQKIKTKETLHRLRTQWRVDEETVNRFKAIVAMYVGTHNFWNFTVGREFKEAASQRNMKSIEVVPPAVYGDVEWLSVAIHGQSFMLHQRKMIALAILLTRSQGQPDIVSNLYEPDRIRVPNAPAAGLFLEEPVFETYNKKIAVANGKWKDAASSGKKEHEDDSEHAQNFIREPLDYDKHKEKIEAFKNKHIYEVMQTTEKEQGTFDAWLNSLDSHEARLFYEARGLPVPEGLGVPTKAGSLRSAASKIDDGDESDDALTKGKVNFKSAELEG
ncbi:9879_t:CDS:2 [Acaulospora colombiana]|uniref:9879_t:CDS:1 n=1 Tax=Acaulospora colombiana TaxID=27376 RepID=A0ACA9MNE9_9GLOM|nr:9879_t:CDS:2 [Acaulospora colombiana]